jgi:hypothetical protein
MIYKKQDFFEYSTESQRVRANLEQTYAAWVDARREADAMPASMYWASKDGSDYLYVKETSQDNGSSIGRRSPQLEAQYQNHIDTKARLKERIHALDAQMTERAGLYRRLRLPSIPDRQAEILRKLDIEGLLGTDLMVVGTNAFIAYELAAGARFPTGNEETEDFDMAWCRGTKASLLGHTARTTGRKTFFAVLKSLDSSYQINPRKPYQAVNQTGYEVELLAAPSTHPLPKFEPFEPMVTLIEQEWLLQGMPLSVVVATVRGRACPLYVPDPRWMALHKLWLAKKPERNPTKKPKDQRQGEVLLDATRFFLSDSHPLNVDFVLSLPEELQPYFNAWCESRRFVPQAEAA